MTFRRFTECRIFPILILRIFWWTFFSFFFSFTIVFCANNLVSCDIQCDCDSAKIISSDFSSFLWVQHKPHSHKWLIYCMKRTYLIKKSEKLTSILYSPIFLPKLCVCSVEKNHSIRRSLQRLNTSAFVSHPCTYFNQNSYKESHIHNGLPVLHPKICKHCKHYVVCECTMHRGLNKHCTNSSRKYDYRIREENKKKCLKKYWMRLLGRDREITN